MNWLTGKRDPNRISRIIKKLELYWSKKDNTDQRLCQLITNLSRAKRNSSDIFFVEDDIFEKQLDEAIKDYSDFESEI